MDKQDNAQESELTTRRDFLAGSAAATVGLATLGPSLYAAGSDELKISLIGCGGRGAGAVNDALSSSPGLRLIGIGDVLPDRVARTMAALEGLEEHEDRIDVPPERRYVGFDAFRKVLELPADIVLLATPPAFRPLHYTAAVTAGKHVFMEKPCCVDAPGYRKVVEANRAADAKGLKVVVGLQRRHQASYEEGIKRIHDGEIGDVMLIRTYFNMPSGGPNYQCRPANIPELEWQLRRWGMFTWLSGDHIVEQAVHEIDIASWIMGDQPPVRANGLGGRQVRIGCGNGQIFDHHFVEYVYADECRHYAQAKQQPGGWTHVSDNAHGTKGMITVGSGPYGTGGPADYSGGEQRASLLAGPESPYLREHRHLVQAVRNDTPLNDGHHGALSSMVAVMGRMVTYSGDEITWEEAANSDLELAPGLENFDWDSEPPVLSDEQGNYPIAMPGQTRAR